MAELNTDGGGSGHGGGKHQKQRAKKSSTKIDMTPMVDLAFLLLTFFMLTTTFSKPKTMEINMPFKDENVKPSKVKHALTFLLSGDDKVFYYYGEFKPAEIKIEKTDYSQNGIRKILSDYNKETIKEINALEEQFKKKEIADTTFKSRRIAAFKKKESLTVLVKTDDKAKYKNVIDVLDELNITSVGKYALVEIDSLESILLKAQL